jgi:hypothetical protein
VNGEDNRVIRLSDSRETILLDPDGAAGHGDNGYGYMIAADNFDAQATAKKLWDLSTHPTLGPGSQHYYSPSFGAGGFNHLSWTHAQPASEVPIADQYVCGSHASSSTTAARSNELGCFRLDGSYDLIMVAPTLTTLGTASAGGDASYNQLPKAGLDVTGRYFMWSSNLGTDYTTMLMVEIPWAEAEDPVEPPAATPIRLRIVGEQ